MGSLSSHKESKIFSNIQEQEGVRVESARTSSVHSRACKVYLIGGNRGLAAEVQSRQASLLRNTTHRDRTLGGKAPGQCGTDRHLDGVAVAEGDQKE